MSMNALNQLAIDARQSRYRQDWRVSGRPADRDTGDLAGMTNQLLSADGSTTPSAYQPPWQR